MTVRDNVIALRKIYHADTLVQHIIHSAAAEIERLRKELEEAKAASLDGQNAMVNQINALCETLRIVNDKMTELRSERDEARRRVCEDAIRNGRVYRRVGSDTVRCETSKEVAEMMGWDCYKENKENTND